MPTVKVKVPEGALRLVDHGEDCHAFATRDGDKLKLDMVIYSGKFIESHWYWGRLGIDLTGIKFPLSRYPVLEGHCSTQKIGHMGKPKINGNLRVDPDAFEFVSTEESKKFQTTAEEGFPYQASMYARPTKIERIERGAKAEVNGLTLSGPGTIWRECIFKEASVCVFGWDEKTEATVFSKKEAMEIELEEIVIPGKAELKLREQTEDNEIEKEVGEVPKTAKELQEKYPDLVKQLTEGLISDHTDKVTKLQADHQKEMKLKEAELEGKEERLLKLEKNDDIRAEKEIASLADSIWAQKLGKSEIAERLFDKVRKHVKFGKFVTDDLFDKAKFGEAVDAEIKDWESKGVTDTILGGGFTEKTEEAAATEKTEEKLVDDTVDDLLKKAGQEPPEK